MSRLSQGAIQGIIKDAVTGVVARLSRSIGRVIEDGVAAEIQRRPAVSRKTARNQRRAARRERRTEITRWVADKRARRVPIFVIELTGGLDTKKKIVAKYGEGAVFEKGKAPPKPA